MVMMHRVSFSPIQRIFVSFVLLTIMGSALALAQTSVENANTTAPVSTEYPKHKQTVPNLLPATQASDNDEGREYKFERELAPVGENPFRRMEEFYKQRAFPNKNIPEGAYENAVKKMESMNRRKGASSLLASQPEWKPLGPNNVGGRTRAIAHHPTQDGLVYVAAAGGGVWKTTNHGADWKPLFDFQTSVCMGALGIDPNNPNVLYAGTGETAPASQMQEGWGTGMYKTTDGGDTWKLIGLSTVGSFSKVYVHPKNSNLVYAGAMRLNQGLYKSTDAGKNWTRMNRLSVSDVTLNPENPDELYIGVNGSGVFKTTDGGNTWLNKSAGLPGDLATGFVTVQLAPSQPQTLYCLLEGPDPAGSTFNTVGAIYKTTDGGELWSKSFQGSGSFFAASGNPAEGQGSYNNYIAVHPTNPQISYAGGIYTWRTTNGGGNWSICNPNVHVDQHCIEFNPKNPSEIYMGNDGGMYRSTDNGFNWASINNNYAVTAFYAMDIDESAENKQYGGSQDNGSWGSVDEQVNWSPFWGGDGFFCIVNPVDPKWVVFESQNGGNIGIRNVVTGEAQPFMQGLNPADTTDAAAWSAPISIDPVQKVLYHGRRRVWYRPIGTSSWAPISANPLDEFSISAVTPSQLDETIVWAGTEGGNVFRTTDLGDSWVNVSFNGLPKRFVRDIITSKKDKSTAWVCFSGFGTGHVYKTTDNGGTWRDLSNSLPDIPVNAMEVNPDNEEVIFAGTDIGVFATFNGGETWIPFGKGLPRAPVLDMKVYEAKKLLRIATHGRSMWEIPIPSTAVTDPEITSPTGGEVIMATSAMVFSWSGFQGPVNLDITYSDGDTWTRLGSNVVGNVFRYIVENRPTERAKIRVTSVANSSISLISNVFSILEFQRGSVQGASSLAQVAYGISYDGNNGLWTTSFYSPKFYKMNATTMLVEKEYDMPKGEDQNCTDLTYNRETHQIYIHRLLATTNNARAKIIVMDSSGKFIKTLASPAASSYGIGIEFVDGKLIVSERDGNKNIYVCTDQAEVQQTLINPFRDFYGPRCMAYDGKNLIYQVGTTFSAGGGGLQGVYLVRMAKDKLNVEKDRMELINSNGGTINARGIEIDPRDGNYWVTDLAGNIYKIANFDTPKNPLSSVNDVNSKAESGIILSPNPARDQTVVSYYTGRSDANVSIEVFDVLGVKVAELINRYVTSDDNNAVMFDCSNLPNGVYTVSMTVDGVRRPGENIIVNR